MDNLLVDEDQQWTLGRLFFFLQTIGLTFTCLAGWR